MIMRFGTQVPVEKTLWASRGILSFGTQDLGDKNLVDTPGILNHGTQVPGTKIFGNGSPVPCQPLKFTGRLTSVNYLLKNILPDFIGYGFFSDF